MERRPLGRTGTDVSPIGFGAFKIGRNQKIKYPQPYALPDESQVDRLLGGVLDLGINLIDTAPAYGVSEERIGRHLSHRRDEFVLSTKVGENFWTDRTGQSNSNYEFSAKAIIASVERSLKRLRSDRLDLVLLHSDGRDLFILRDTPAVETLVWLRDAGKIGHIGLSGKTAAGHHAALDWADVIMVEYNALDTGQSVVMDEAAKRGVGVLVKKGLAAGHLDPETAIPFALAHDAVASLTLGGLNLDHFAANVSLAADRVAAAA
ncbi:aldo/keto reductase [Stratiformator vulcanicus]|uniref:General stress protein 69 n=1 Tax=Stratiformator vulcanicus TaxID=2527980 RepID=A0A517R7T6_9PLAN|nr:aldo/keto reductase [Stratiformator vulcanicus]QDT39893.1 General stress protein 69 [Stratiformator vulcanicus]